MTTVLVLLFIIVTAIPWIARTSSNMFHPLNVFVAMQLILIVPGLILVALDPSVLDPQVANVVVGEFYPALNWTVMLMTALNLAVYAGFYLVHPKARLAAANRFPLIDRPTDSYVFIAFLLVLIILVFMVKVDRGGGFEFMLSNTRRRVELQRGLGGFDLVENAARWLLIITSVRLALLRPTYKSKLALAGVFLFCFVEAGIFGSRKAALDLFVLGIMTAALYRRDWFEISARNLLIAAALYLSVLAYLYVALLYRNSETGTDFVGAISASWFDFKSLLLSISYVDTYYFITNFYTKSTYYYGALFGDLKTGLLPSAMFPDKAIVDDGVYVKYALQGMVLAPQTPVSQIYADSLPPETLGGAYMNAGPLLVPVYGLLLGAFLGGILKIAERRPNALFWIAMLVFSFTTFELSNLRIISFVTLAFATAGLLMIANGFAKLAVGALRSYDPVPGSAPFGGSLPPTQAQPRTGNPYGRAAEQ